MEKKVKNIVIVRVKSDLEKPMDIDILAESIKSVADNFDKAINSGLTMKGLCVLIQASMPQKDRIGINDIENVLVYASNLRKFVKK